jgi:HEPN domain-containing protein
MADWQGRLTDAGDFLAVARMSLQADYPNQAASNAVLSAIAANDAVCLFFGRAKPSGDSHSEAVRALQEASRGRPWESEAAGRCRQFLDIVRRKNDAQYRGRRMAPEEAERVLRQAERFVEWAEGLLAGGRA